MTGWDLVVWGWLFFLVKHVCALLESNLEIREKRNKDLSKGTFVQ